MTNKVEIAYLRSGHARVVCVADSRFFVEVQAIRGEHKLGRDPIIWKKLYGVWDREKAIRLLESYGS
jgi:hypothetical protein